MFAGAQLQYSVSSFKHTLTKGCSISTYVHILHSKLHTKYTLCEAVMVLC